MKRTVELDVVVRCRGLHRDSGPGAVRSGRCGH